MLAQVAISDKAVEDLDRDLCYLRNMSCVRRAHPAFAFAYNVDDIMRGDLDLRLSCPHAELQKKRCSELMRRAMMSASPDPWSIAGAGRMHGPISLCLRSWATVTRSAAKVPKWHLQHWAMPLGLFQIQQTGLFPPQFYALSPHQATAAVEELAGSPRGQGSLLKPSDVWDVMIHLEVT